MFTSWTKATTYFNVALLGLINCLDTGRNAWIEVQKNGEQDFPIVIKNPVLDDPFNWTMMYGVPRNEKELANLQYFNHTEKDLTYNWYAAFSTPEAAELYRKDGTVTAGLFKGMGICTPVKISDIDAWRSAPFNYTWITHWKPKDNIPYWIPDSINEVYVVCFDDGPVNKKASYLRMSSLLHRLAEEI